MTVKVTGTVTAVNRQQLERILLSAGARRLLRSAPALRSAIDREVKAQIRANFQTNRTTARRRDPGSRRLIHSFESYVESGGPGRRDAQGRFLAQFPLTVGVRPVAQVRNNANAMAKINSLNSGSKEHKIPGRPWLIFPWYGKGQNRGPYTVGSEARQFHATHKPNVRARKVKHPGTVRTDFLGQAIRNVKRQLRSTMR